MVVRGVPGIKNFFHPKRRWLEEDFYQIFPPFLPFFSTKTIFVWGKIFPPKKICCTFCCFDGPLIHPLEVNQLHKKPRWGKIEDTLQEINISHLRKRKIIFKYAIFEGYVSSLEGTFLLNCLNGKHFVFLQLNLDMFKMIFYLSIVVNHHQNILGTFSKHRRVANSIKPYWNNSCQRSTFHHSLDGFIWSWEAAKHRTGLFSEELEAISNQHSGSKHVSFDLFEVFCNSTSQLTAPQLRRGVGGYI